MKYKLLFLFFWVVQPLFSQILEPVKWSFSSKYVQNNEYLLIFKATIDENWYIYSSKLESDEGPNATSFTFEKTPSYTLKGNVKELNKNRTQEFDKIFSMNLIKIKKEAVFWQSVIVKDSTQPINGVVNFMTCDDTRCLPPTDVEFAIYINIPKLSANSKISNNNFESQKDTKENTSQPSAENLPQFSFQDINKIEENTIYAISTIDSKPLEDCSSSNNISRKKSKTIWGIFLLGILGGLIALLTPCVFPMIPLTVSFFTKSHEQGKRKGKRNAILYGLFILLVYVLLSIPFHLLDSINPDILNDISTNVWLNIFFFLIFLFFAFSFFGYYEITLPSSWSNRISTAESIGGIIGIFFMALTLSLVSFSCTGPILGSLLAGALSTQGGAWQLTAGMTGFGIALALPFALFAMFPGWMKKLPKSGGWLNTVKVVLGFLELALALKFLSNADLVKHWGLLKIEPFLLLWIIIFLGLGIYLFGKIKFPHDTPLKKLSILRIISGLLTIGFALYLATGFIYNKEKQSFTSLKLLSGLAPPVGYSWIYPTNCPNNLNCYKDFSQGLIYAKETKKPILLDFTGHACVNCRKMEEHVWTDSRVYKLINEKYVLISLYVEKNGLLKPGKTIVENTSGNTGASVAMIAAIKGYKAILTMPDKVSIEKQDALKALGAKVIITPTSAPSYSPKHYVNVAKRIAKDIPNSFRIDQYDNLKNPEAHYVSTGPEIWKQTNGAITHFIAAGSTGGTISGVGKYLKEKNPKIKIIMVDPLGSIFYDYFKTGKINPASACTYHVEGAGEDHLVKAIDFNVIDDIYQFTCKEAFATARKLASIESVMGGGTAGANVWGALKLAKICKKDAIIVTVIPDNGIKYLSKFYNDEWMRKNNLLRGMT